MVISTYVCSDLPLGNFLKCCKRCVLVSLLLKEKRLLFPLEKHVRLTKNLSNLSYAGAVAKISPEFFT